MKEKADEFLALFNKIESHLRRLLNVDNNTSMKSMLDRYEQMHPGWRGRNDLRSAAELRNLLVHRRTEPDRFPAYPSDEMMAQLRRCHAQLLNPRRLEQDHLRAVETVIGTDKLSHVLRVIRERDFSQFPVIRDADVTGLLTENGITRFLARYVHAHDSLLELDDITVDEVLSEERAGSNYRLVERTMTVDDACAVFARNPVLEALLITQRGKPSERLLGIMTRYDALESL